MNNPTTCDCPQPTIVVWEKQEQAAHSMAQDVLDGLTRHPQKQLQPMYFYDEVGSLLYELITELPEYYPTRTEAALLKQVAPEILKLANPVEMVELGSGSSTKTRILLDAFRGVLKTYIPTDISQTMLTATENILQHDYPTLEISGLYGTFETALASLLDVENRMFVFLGSTIGNFPPAYQTLLMQNIFHTMSPGHFFLLGYDMQPNVQKPQAVIEAAYNDADGITAQFNLNMLCHINKVLGADFNLKDWKHRAIYNTDAHQIEMHLESLRDQKVFVQALQRTFTFEKGETILTEISRKYDPTQLSQEMKKIGFDVTKSWVSENQYFGLMLLTHRNVAYI